MKLQGLTGAIAPKEWKDLNKEEKIERIRKEIHNVQRSLVRLRIENGNLKEQFLGHEHLNGRVVKEISRYSGGEDSAKSIGTQEQIKNGECYF